MDKHQLIKLNKRQLGKGLRGIRTQYKYTLEDVAFLSGKDVAYLSRIECGKTSPRFETISDILSVYNMSIKEMYDKMDYFLD